MADVYVAFLITTTVISTLAIPIFTLNRCKFAFPHTHASTCFHDLSHLDTGKMKSQSRCYLHLQDC